MRARLHCLVQRYSWLKAMLVVLLCAGLLICVLSQTPQSDFQTNIAVYSQGPGVYNSSDAVLVGQWLFASAHRNTSSLLENRQLSLDVDGFDLLMIVRSDTSSLSLTLPLLALFAALALTQARPVSTDDRSIRSQAIACGALSLAVPVVVGLFWAIESHSLGIPFSWSQWSRVLVWLVFVDVYFCAFLLLGSWISKRVRHVKTAAWVFASLFIALFMIQSSRELLMRFDGSLLPQVPELPTEVKYSLFRPSGEPRVTLDREEMVAAYLETVDAYSESVHEVVRDHYQLERWWHVVSPQLLLNEISTQLLQTQLTNIVNVVYSPNNELKPPSVIASITAVWPEVVWLILLAGSAGWGAMLAARRKDGAP